ncbi:MAG TPA: hypothetical protein VN253_25230 [Kofleriaceae bacterium]|nr:hypothetical protein [Kofleriaceae bacterium]
MRTLPLAALLLLFGIGCGKQIGDACGLASDCSPNGDRQCDRASPQGYCTIQGCDHSSCPDEAACIKFFTGGFSNRPCDPATEDNPDLSPDDPEPARRPTDACSLDELCAFTGTCVPRSSEVRFCMRTCDTDGDCRSGYECRDLAKMKAHGGEPVLAPGVRQVDEHAPKFCAAAPK